MPLVQCPDCGKRVSTNASSCVSCGRPLAVEEIHELIRSEEHNTSGRRGCAVMSLGLLLVGLPFAAVAHWGSWGALPQGLRVAGVVSIAVGALILLVCAAWLDQRCRRVRGQSLLGMILDP